MAFKTMVGHVEDRSERIRATSRNLRGSLAVVAASFCAKVVFAFFIDGQMLWTRVLLLLASLALIVAVAWGAALLIRATESSHWRLVAPVPLTLGLALFVENMPWLLACLVGFACVLIWYASASRVAAHIADFARKENMPGFNLWIVRWVPNLCIAGAVLDIVFFAVRASTHSFLAAYGIVLWVELMLSAIRVSNASSAPTVGHEVSRTGTN